MALSDEQKNLLRMNAVMDGAQSVVARIGSKVEVSQMELICLTNFAEVGLMYLFSLLEGKSGVAAEAELEKHLDAIREEFKNSPTDDNGLTRLSQSTVAMLRSEKFGKYLVRSPG